MRERIERCYYSVSRSFIANAQNFSLRCTRDPSHGNKFRSRLAPSNYPRQFLLIYSGKLPSSQRTIVDKNSTALLTLRHSLSKIHGLNSLKKKNTKHNAAFVYINLPGASFILLSLRRVLMFYALITCSSMVIPRRAGNIQINNSIVEQQHATKRSTKTFFPDEVTRNSSNSDPIHQPASKLRPRLFLA